jgi:hypothetical protein
MTISWAVFGPGVGKVMPTGLGEVETLGCPSGRNCQRKIAVGSVVPTCWKE